MITDCFWISIGTIFKENKLIAIMQFINPTYSWKNGVKQRKVTQKIIAKMHVLPHC